MQREVVDRRRTVGQARTRAPTLCPKAGVDSYQSDATNGQSEDNGVELKLEAAAWNESNANTAPRPKKTKQS